MCRVGLRTVAFLAVLGFSLPAAAQLAFPAWIVPVVVKSPGLNGTSWASDIFLTNIGDTEVRLSAHYFEGGHPNTFNGTFSKPVIRVLPGRTVQVRDVVGTWFPGEGNQTKGWLLIADTTQPDCDDEDAELAKVLVSTRVYNTAGGGGTYGQIVEAQWTTVNTSKFPSVFTGIRNQGSARPGSRTNVGVTNISTVPIEVEIALYRGNGSIAGRKTRTIKALSLEQWSFAQLGFPEFSSTGGRLEVRLTHPNIDPCAEDDDVTVCFDLCDPACDGKYGFGDIQAFIAYASNIDNITGDGENMISVIDQSKFFDWYGDYTETHCPEKNHGQPFPVYLAHRLFGAGDAESAGFTRVTD